MLVEVSPLPVEVSPLPVEVSPLPEEASPEPVPRDISLAESESVPEIVEDLPRLRTPSELPSLTSESELSYVERPENVPLPPSELSRCTKIPLRTHPDPLMFRGRPHRNSFGRSSLPSGSGPLS